MEAPSALPFKLDLNFFGFSAKDRIALHTKLFNLLEAGQGKWDWITIYNLPVPIRRLWISQINQRIEEQSNQKKSKKTN